MSVDELMHDELIGMRSLSAASLAWQLDTQSGVTT